MNARTFLAASALPSREARLVLAVICSSTTRRRARQARAAPYLRTRGRLAGRFERALRRVLDFAKHETLRKLHRYAFTHRPLRAQEEQPTHPDAGRLSFNADELRQDLIRMLQMEVPGVVGASAAATLAGVGYRDPWRLPAQETLDLIAQRMNLISGLPDELFADVQRELSGGLNAGESIAQLSARIDRIFSPERAALIAETETGAAYGFASQAASLAAGVRFKQWIHSGLPKEPREDHLDIDGLIVPIDDFYPVGDPPLMYPHDPDGSAEDVINCGCISIPATEDDYQAQQGEEAA